MNLSYRGGTLARVPDLTDDDLAVLDIESRPWRFAGAKANAIRARFGISETLYYQRLNLLIDNPAAYVHSPTLVKRLRRLRDTRRQRRT